MKRLRILPEVHDDVLEAVRWYDNQELGVGDHFLNTFRDVFDSLQRNPLIYPMVHQEFRRVLLRPFPYALYFRLHEEEAVVVMVFHTARNPEFMLQRLQLRKMTV